MRLLLAGPDGTGKSSLMAELVRIFEARQLEVRHGHWTPGLFAHASNNRGGPPAPASDPHAHPEHGVLVSALKALVIYIDTWMGWIGRWRPRVGEVLIVERGFADMAVDSKRYRLSSDLRPALGVLTALSPRYDVAVLLLGDEQVIHRRKPELPVEELARQMASWRDLAPRTARTVIEVDVTQESPHELARQVEQAARNA